MRSAQEQIPLDHQSTAPDDSAEDADKITVEDIRSNSTVLPEKSAASINQWLDWQSRMIHGVHASAVYLRNSQDFSRLCLAASWSSTGVDSTFENRPLASVAWRCFRSESQVLEKVSDENLVMQDHLAFPIYIQNKVYATVALSMSVRSNEQTQAVVQLQQWCAVWLENLLEPLTAEKFDSESLVLESFLVLSRDIPLPLSLHLLCSLLAERLKCSSVSIGLSRGLKVVTAAVSDQLEFERRTERIRELENAMEECVDQRATICSPAKLQNHRQEPGAHNQMILRQAIVSVCSAPLLVDDKIVGVVSCTRNSGDLLDEIFVNEVSSLVNQLAPLIQRQHRLEKPFGRYRRAASSAPDKTPGGIFKISPSRIFALIFLMLLIAFFIPVDHRVSAASVIEGTFQQAITVPFSGQLQAVHARAGDQVVESQILAELNDTELLLEREKWRVEQSRQNKEYQLALAARDRAQVGMSSARLAQSEAELQLLDNKLAQTKLVAPFSGLLVSGDWSQSLGAPVETGQLMFEIVPLEGYRLILEVDEHDIAYIAPGQQGSVRLAGLPSHSIDIDIIDILPIAKPHNGANYFRVEADVLEAPLAIRPGMQGVAKIIVGKTRLVDVWFGTLLARLRLVLWGLGT
ncbi:MAG: efflux RND transporter periplasmic adaptor subunit [Granulosicoccus sp.]